MPVPTDRGGGGEGSPSTHGRLARAADPSRPRRFPTAAPSSSPRTGTVVRSSQRCLPSAASAACVPVRARPARAPGMGLRFGQWACRVLWVAGGQERLEGALEPSATRQNSGKPHAFTLESRPTPPYLRLGRVKVRSFLYLREHCNGAVAYYHHRAAGTLDCLGVLGGVRRSALGMGYRRTPEANGPCGQGSGGHRLRGLRIRGPSTGLHMTPVPSTPLDKER